MNYFYLRLIISLLLGVVIINNNFSQSLHFNVKDGTVDYNELGEIKIGSTLSISFEGLNPLLYNYNVIVDGKDMDISRPLTSLFDSSIFKKYLNIFEIIDKDEGILRNEVCYKTDIARAILNDALREINEFSIISKSYYYEEFSPKTDFNQLLITLKDLKRKPGCENALLISEGINLISDLMVNDTSILAAMKNYQDAKITHMLPILLNNDEYTLEVFITPKVDSSIAPSFYRKIEFKTKSNLNFGFSSGAFIGNSNEKKTFPNSIKNTTNIDDDFKSYMGIGAFVTSSYKSLTFMIGPTANVLSDKIEYGIGLGPGLTLGKINKINICLLFNFMRMDKIHPEFDKMKSVDLDEISMEDLVGTAIRPSLALSFTYNFLTF